ncbi:MAG: hypothetical protein ACP5R4_00220 [Armatimonadota bacterium]
MTNAHNDEEMETLDFDVNRKAKLVEWHLNKFLGEGTLEFQDAVDLYLELREASSHAEIDRIVKRLQSLLKKKVDPSNPQCSM